MHDTVQRTDMKSTHDEHGIITLILNSNDSEGSSDSLGLELEVAPLKIETSTASADSAASADSEACSPDDPPRKCFEFFRRFSYKRLWGDSQR